MAGLRVGALNRRIVLQRVTETQDAIGHPVQSWADIATVWADVQPVSGKEALSNERNLASSSARFIIHYRSGLTTKDRISFDGKLWDVLYIREIGFKAGTEIVAEVRQ